MTGTEQTLTFLSWVRSGIGGLVTAHSGRTGAGGHVDHADRVRRRRRAGRTETQAGLVPGRRPGRRGRPAARRDRAPLPGARGRWTTNRTAAPTSSWPTRPCRGATRPAPTPAGANLHPWLVLVVGQEGSELTLTGGQVTIEVSAQQDTQALGDPASAYRFAHVQQDAAGHRVTRVLSGRPLQPGTDYLAVVVPAYDPSGARSWTGAAAVTVPVYDALAVPHRRPGRQLRGSRGAAAAGRRPGHHRPRPAALPAAGRRAGARACSARWSPGPLDGPVAEDPLPADVQADLAALRLPARDPQGRPIVTLPRYGEAWRHHRSPTRASWARDLNLDPRHRGVAGLGLEVGIRRAGGSRRRRAGQPGRAARGPPADAPPRAGAGRVPVAVAAPGARRPGSAAVAARPGAEPARHQRRHRRRAGDRGRPDDRAGHVLGRRPAGRCAPGRPGPRWPPPTLTPAALVASANRPPPPPPASIDGVPLDDAGLRALDTARAQAIQRRPRQHRRPAGRRHRARRRRGHGGPAGGHPARHRHAAGRPGGQGGAVGAGAGDARRRRRHRRRAGTRSRRRTLNVLGRGTCPGCGTGSPTMPTTRPDRRCSPRSARCSPATRR